MLCYPATLERDNESGAVLAGFVDIPFAHTVGDDEAEALLNAVDALTTAFAVFVERRERIPEPSAPAEHQPVVVLPVVVAGKVALHNALIAAGMGKADLARKLNITPTLVDHLLSFRHHSRIEQIETALALLDRRLAIQVIEAA
ncbi:MAG: type II toxin-antitoxin system HicB family antitoxin [Lamprocystis purpurea]|jgi:antitoxin HicB|uniref:type II toxin-antitoxin system HicB family antitoxin n=1 Tax=Lamprocystis purpurea TaxID=61598 RepID=UPI0003611F37|nr:type II toxin-antitoxin system HicB family antitoxin [Lamprocystis purpurea]MBV5272664.1 type II toxin-antitoxin system HicB family antitoxin [Lamprocystis purpurea]